MSKRVQVRQGDVLLDPIATVLVGGTPISPTEEGCVLAYDPESGHTHIIRNPFRSSLTKSDSGLILQCEEDCILSHEEHAPVAVAKGSYRVLLQREQDIGHEQRRVID